jgi:transcription initiation factor IIE alpha subunit
MKRRTGVVFVCHECHVAGAAVDEDGCCTGCGCDLDAYEENAYAVGKGFAVVETAALRAEVRDLKARLKAVRPYWATPSYENHRQELKRITNLRVKNWREP